MREARSESRQAADSFARSSHMDRKQRIREYKETPRPMGVYRVRNTVDGVSFVGSSVNVTGMLNRYRFELESGSGRDRDSDSALRDDWNRLGADAFDFEVLDTLKPLEEPGYDPGEGLRMLEELWCEKLVAAAERLY